MRAQHLPSFSITVIILLSLLVVNCIALPAPFWLKEGAYAYYYIEFNPLQFMNGTQIWYGNGTYGWKVLGVAGNNAILEILVSITGKRLDPNETKTKPYAFAANYTISINVETREAFSGNEYLGFLPYWIPTDVEKLPYIAEDRLPDWAPKIKWKVIENFATYDNITTYGLVGNVSATIETPYKTFKGYELWAILGAFDPTHGFTYIYDKDSGLWITNGVDNFWRKILKVNNPALELLLKDTNIYSMPESSSLFTFLLPYIITATAIIAAATSIYFIKVRKKS